MKIAFAGIFADAGELWRANRDLLIRVAAVFYFLPMLGELLFLPVPQLAGVKPDSKVLELWLAWYVQNAHWMVASAVVETYGTGLLLVLLLDSERPTLGEAMARALRLLPVLVVALIGARLLFALGIFAFVLPGLYLAGRTFLTGAVVIAERRSNPVAAIVEGIARTRGNGWMLLLIAMVVGIAVWLLLGTLSGVGNAVATLPGGRAASYAAVAAAAAAGQLFQVLLQAAAYRALTPRQGI